MNKVALPLTMSSTAVSGDLSDVRIEANPFVNAGITAADAPILLTIRSGRTLDGDACAARMVATGGQGTLAQARLVINAIAGVFSDLVGEYGAITVQTPFGTVETYISGTVENATDQPDPEKNQVFLVVVVPEVYRRQFAQIETYVPANACPAALKRIRDKATNRQLIDGTNPFYLEGRGMTIGGDGETLELLNAVTREKLCDVSVDEEKSGKAQFLCTLAPQTAIESGEYLVRLMTLAGGEPGSALWPVELKVEYVAPEPIVFTSATSEGDETGHVRPDTDVTIVGTGLLALRDSEDLWIENGEHGGPLTFVSVAPDGHSMKVAVGELEGVGAGETMTVCAKDSGGMYIASCDVTIFL